MGCGGRRGLKLWIPSFSCFRLVFTWTLQIKHSMKFDTSMCSQAKYFHKAKKKTECVYTQNFRNSYTPCLKMSFFFVQWDLNALLSSSMMTKMLSVMLILISCSLSFFVSYELLAGRPIPIMASQKSPWYRSLCWYVFLCQAVVIQFVFEEVNILTDCNS